jgi:hypothetical protein
LKVLQSVLVSTPRAEAEEVGILSAIAGVVVLLVTATAISVPVVSTEAETLVTVPTNWSAEAMLKLGYEPVIVVVPLPVSETVWSGAVLAIVIEPSPLVTLMPVLAVIVALASEPSEVLPIALYRQQPWEAYPPSAYWCPTRRAHG